mmetsp:Transcript_49461/g.119958  ORF Transcript_49461/g.119958 Transcript_49461/m.119958 type:complete len:94 (+) Transcript_49461:18-299(+)
MPKKSSPQCKSSGMASPRSARRLSEGMDWLGQSLADLPADPTYGVPFMAGTLVLALCFLYWFFDRERKLGRLPASIHQALGDRHPGHHHHRRD